MTIAPFAWEVGIIAHAPRSRWCIDECTAFASATTVPAPVITVNVNYNPNPNPNPYTTMKQKAK